MKHTLYIMAAIAISLFASCSSEASKNDSPKSDSTASKMESKAERNKKTAMASEAGLIAHDAAATTKDGAANFMEYQDGTTPPISLDSCRKMLSMFFSCFPDMKPENQVYVANDNTVAVISDWTMTFKNDMGPIKATGKTAKYRDVDIFTFDDNGKITSHRNIYPTAALFMQLGVDMTKMQKEMAGGNKETGEQKKM